MRESIKKKLPDTAPAIRQAEVQRDLAQAAGTEFFQNRDPLYHVTESFQQTFDHIGRRHAASLAGNQEQSLPREEAVSQAEAERGTESKVSPAGQEPLARKGKGEPRLRNLPNTMIPLQQFSETAFQRGTLSASILAGTGKMMLVSCMKRTIGQSGPKRIQQQSIFDTGSQTRNIPNRDPDQMLFNRSFAGGAVGLVVDTIRDARRVVQSMEDMARGTGELYSKDTGTLRAMYPFLDDSRERQLLEQYTSQLEQTSDGRERAVLQNGLVHVRSLLTKKRQMKVEFINKLRLISDRAIEAQAEFEAPGFVDEVAAALETPEEAPPPMEEPPPDTGDSHDPDRPEDRQPEYSPGAEAPSGAEPVETGT